MVRKGEIYHNDTTTRRGQTAERRLIRRGRGCLAGCDGWRLRRSRCCRRGGFWCRGKREFPIIGPSRGGFTANGAKFFKLGLLTRTFLA